MAGKVGGAGDGRKSLQAKAPGGHLGWRKEGKAWGPRSHHAVLSSCRFGQADGESLSLNLAQRAPHMAGMCPPSLGLWLEQPEELWPLGCAAVVTVASGVSVPALCSPGRDSRAAQLRGATGSGCFFNMVKTQVAKLEIYHRKPLNIIKSLDKEINLRHSGLCASIYLRVSIINEVSDRLGRS